MAKTTKEYNSWHALMQRCYNPNRYGYEYYGGRGIKVCKRWHKFKNFLADVGLAPSKKHSADRFPNINGDYEPGNFRWATPEMQSNNKRNNCWIEVNGVRKTYSQWEKYLGMKRGTIGWRIKEGLAPEKAVFAPYNPIPKVDKSEAKKLIKSGMKTKDIAEKTGIVAQTIYSIRRAMIRDSAQ